MDLTVEIRHLKLKAQLSHFIREEAETQVMTGPGPCHRWEVESVAELGFWSLCFFFFKSIYFNRRIIALRYCADFYHIAPWISHRYTYVPSLWNLPSIPSHSSRLLQSLSWSSLGHTVNSHWLSVLLQQCICFHATLSVHPTFSFLPLLVSVSLFSMSVSPLPPCK